MKSGRKLPTVPRKVSEQRRIQAPGPGAYQPYKDGIEIESPRKNTVKKIFMLQEKHSFSKADREQYYKTFIDEKINEKVPNSITKNCAFYINPEYEGIGTQQISNSGAKNSPRIVFGKYGSEIVKVSPIKDQNPVVSKNTPFQYPQSTLSRVPDSNIKNSAKLSFGKEQRFAYDNVGALLYLEIYTRH